MVFIGVIVVLVPLFVAVALVLILTILLVLLLLLFLLLGRLLSLWVSFSQVRALLVASVKSAGFILLDHDLYFISGSQI
jgi:hypothetical protein